MKPAAICSSAQWLRPNRPNAMALASALERVQGPSRLMLEEFRCNARRDGAVQATTTTSAPAPQIITPQERDSGVLREKRVVPLEELLRPGGPQTFADEPAQPPTPPQAGTPAERAPAETPATKPAEQPATPPQTPVENPFGDDAAHTRDHASTDRYSAPRRSRAHAARHSPGWARRKSLRRLISNTLDIQISAHQPIRFCARCCFHESARCSTNVAGRCSLRCRQLHVLQRWETFTGRGLSKCQTDPGRKLQHDRRNVSPAN